ncbi:MAG: hypothetical protein DMG22_02275 [Acidobacteria bacterium]|nr:MAG: hypothetical protein DMG22_02275 [Acidobacteriota bacterium]
METSSCVRDEHRAAPTLPGKPHLLLPLDAVEHLELEVLPCKPRGQRIAQIFAWHEASNGPPREAMPRQLLAQPAVLRSP